MLSFNTRKGEELKVPYHASVAAIRDGNLPPIVMIYFSYTRSTLKREELVS